MNPWTPEFPVSPEIAALLIQTQFPQIGSPSLEVLDSGWDNIVYSVNNRWLFRFPQREIAVKGVELEIACLPRLKGWIEGIPAPSFIGKPSSGYPWPFFGYEPVAGRESPECALDESGRTRIARPLGSLLAKLHSRATLERVGIELPVDPLGRLDFGRRIPMTESRLEGMKARGETLPYEELIRVLNLARRIPRLEASALVHGDLHFRHLIVTDGGDLGGLIDWGDLHLNDPALDLQVYWSFFPPCARAGFLSAYGAVTDAQLIQARSFAIFVNTALLEYALAEKRKSVETEARFALLNILSS